MGKKSDKQLAGLYAKRAEVNDEYWDLSGDVVHALLDLDVSCFYYIGPNNAMDAFGEIEIRKSGVVIEGFSDKSIHLRLHGRERIEVPVASSKLYEALRKKMDNVRHTQSMTQKTESFKRVLAGLKIAGGSDEAGQE